MLADNLAVDQTKTQEFHFYFSFEGRCSEGKLSITAADTADLSLGSINNWLKADFEGYRWDKGSWSYNNNRAEFGGEKTKLWKLWYFMDHRYDLSGCANDEPELFEAHYQGFGSGSYRLWSVSAELTDSRKLEEWEENTGKFQVSPLHMLTT